MKIPLLRKYVGLFQRLILAIVFFSPAQASFFGERKTVDETGSLPGGVVSIRSSMSSSSSLSTSFFNTQEERNAIDALTSDFKSKNHLKPFSSADDPTRLPGESRRPGHGAIAKVVLSHYMPSDKPEGKEERRSRPGVAPSHEFVGELNFIKVYDPRLVDGSDSKEDLSLDGFLSPRTYDPYTRAFWETAADYTEMLWYMAFHRAAGADELMDGDQFEHTLDYFLRMPAYRKMQLPYTQTLQSEHLRKLFELYADTFTPAPPGGLPLKPTRYISVNQFAAAVFCLVLPGLPEGHDGLAATLDHLHEEFSKPTFHELFHPISSEPAAKQLVKLGKVPGSVILRVGTPKIWQSTPTQKSPSERMAYHGLYLVASYVRSNQTDGHALVWESGPFDLDAMKVKIHVDMMEPDDHEERKAGNRYVQRGGEGKGPMPDLAPSRSLGDPGTPSPGHGLTDEASAHRLLNLDLRGKEVALSAERPLALLESDIREAGASCVTDIREGESSSTTLKRLENLYGQHGSVCSHYSHFWDAYRHVTRYVVYSMTKKCAVMLEKRVGKGKWDYKYYYEKGSHQAFLDVFTRSEGRRCVRLPENLDPFRKPDEFVTVSLPVESVSAPCSSSSSTGDDVDANKKGRYVRRPPQVKSMADPISGGAPEIVGAQEIARLFQMDMVLVADLDETKGNHKRHRTLLEYLWKLTDEHDGLEDVPPADAYRHLLVTNATKAPEGAFPWRKYRDDVELMRCPAGTVGYALVWCDEDQSVIATRLSERGRMEHYKWLTHCGKPLTLESVRMILDRFAYKNAPGRGTWVSFF